MTAVSDQMIDLKLHAAKSKRDALAEAVVEERKATVAFIDEALAARWSWEDVGRALGISGTGARRYHGRNRRKVHSVV